MFPNIYRFCNKDLNKFILLLRKVVYPYKYMDNWKRFNETELPPKIDFYNNFELEDITDEDYKHAQKVWDAFNIKNLGEYHDLCVQSCIDRCMILIFINLIQLISYQHLD